MKSQDNFATEGLSGSYKQISFRQLHGKTIAAKRPGKRKKAATAAQLLIVATFKKAATFAKSILTDPLMKAAYKAKAQLGQSAYNRALADFFKAPEIEEIDHSLYNGQIGSILEAVVTDDFKVVTVRVRINKSNGTLIEEGPASLSSDGLNWTYTTTVQNDALTGTVISFTATDTPGHSIVKSKTI